MNCLYLSRKTGSAANLRSMEMNRRTPPPPPPAVSERRSTFDEWQSDDGTTIRIVCRGVIVVMDWGRLLGRMCRSVSLGGGVPPLPRIWRNLLQSYQSAH